MGAKPKPRATVQSGYRKPKRIEDEFCFRCGEEAPQHDGFSGKPLILCDTCAPGYEPGILRTRA